MPTGIPVTTDLASGSTLLQEYQDNCDYDLDGSVTKCQAFIKACRKLLAGPSLMSRGGSITNTLQFDLGEIRAQLQKAENWYRQNSTSTSVQAGSASQTTLVTFPSDFRR